jgi:hypothetical protein
VVQVKPGVLASGRILTNMTPFPIPVIIVIYFLVSASQSVVQVKPEVLASGRILTNMTPFPITAIVSE